METPPPASSDVAVVIVPFPAQGHLNQLLHLSRLLSSHGLHVHFAASATHNRQAKLRVEGWDPLTISNIHFHDLALPPFANPPPNPHAPSKFPDHLLPAFEASTHLHLPFASLLRSLSPSVRRLAVIHEILTPFAAQEASNHPNAESYVFHCSSAIYLLQREEAMRKQKTNLSFDSSSSIESYLTAQFFKFIYSQRQLMTVPSGHLFNTCRPIEDRFLKLLAQGPFLDSKMWVAGPLNPINSGNISHPCGRHWCLEWLDKQPPKSVIYVSFGSVTSLSDEQILELAIGLERSDQRFVWVVREADRGNIFVEEEEVRRIQLPEGYEKRVEDVGRVVREWAPQVEILGHGAVGGFMSHCGWNSCMESMSMGVPMAAWPMHSDQPRNAMLVTEVLKIGVMVREWDRREEMVMAEEVEDVVRKLMGCEEGKGMRKRAEELGSAVRAVWSEGGSSRVDLDSFVRHISRE